MIKYRILKKKNEAGGWINYMIYYQLEDGNFYYTYSNGPRSSLMGIDDLEEINTKFFPTEDNVEFMLEDVKDFGGQETEFEPNQILSDYIISSTNPDVRVYQISISEAPSLMQEVQELLTRTEQQLSSARNEDFEAKKRDRLKKHFIQSLEENNNSTHIPPDIIKYLWQAWKEHDTPLFDEPVYNVGLLLFARIFECPVDQIKSQKDYLEQHQNQYEAILPQLPTWGARASLSKNILGSINSPTVQVFVFSDQKLAYKIVLLGRGLPHIRDEILSNALVTSLRLQASYLDLYNEGFISIEARDGTDEDALNILGNYKPIGSAEQRGEAIKQFLRTLERLSRETGFIQIHKLTKTDETRFQEHLRKVVRETNARGKATLWAPDPSFAEIPGELILPHTFSQLRRNSANKPTSGRRTRGGSIKSLSLSINPHILDTSAWKRLFEAFYHEKIEGIRMDAQHRKDYYDAKVKSLKTDNEDYTNLAKELEDNPTKGEEMDARFPKEYWLNTRFDDDLGLSIGLAKPEKVTREKYLLEQVPGLIKMYKGWAKRMQDTLDAIANATQGRKGSTFQRLIFARCTDCALKGRSLGENSFLENVFATWSEPIRDLLQFLWRLKFKQFNTDPKVHFGVNTSFSAHFKGSKTEMGDAVSEVQIIPFAAIDIKRSVILANPENGVLMVKDAADMASTTSVNEPPNVSFLEGLEKLENQSLQESLKWLRATLYHNPEKGAKAVLDLLGMSKNIENPAEQGKVIKKIRDKGMYQAQFIRKVHRADNAMLNDAILTAKYELGIVKKLVPEIWEQWFSHKINEEGDNPLPTQNALLCDITLLEAAAEAVWHSNYKFFLNPTNKYVSAKELILDANVGTIAIEQGAISELMTEARQQDQDRVDNWIQYLRRQDLGAAVSKIKQFHPKESNLLPSDQYQVLQLFDALELVELIRKLRAAKDMISHFQEDRVTAVTKLGAELETILLSYAADAFYMDAKNLFGILVGKE